MHAFPTAELEPSHNRKVAWRKECGLPRPSRVSGSSPKNVEVASSCTRQNVSRRSSSRQITPTALSRTTALALCQQPRRSNRLIRGPNCSQSPHANLPGKVTSGTKNGGSTCKKLRLSTCKLRSRSRLPIPTDGKEQTSRRHVSADFVVPRPGYSPEKSARLRARCQPIACFFALLFKAR